MLDRSEWAGQLSMRFESRNGRTVAARQYHQDALRVLRPHYLDETGQVTYTVVNPGGAYLGADRYFMSFELDDSANLLLTTQSAQKIYRTPQGPAQQDMWVTLGPHSTLEYVPDQLIVYREGSYIQKTVIDMDPTASALVCEVVTPGWAPDGSTFRYKFLSMRTELRVRTAQGPVPIAVDNIRVEPRDDDSVVQMGFMEGYSHMGQLLVADSRLDDAAFERLAQLIDASHTMSGMSWAGHRNPEGMRCISIRSLAQDTETISQLHLDVANFLRNEWRGQGELFLRKY